MTTTPNAHIITTRGFQWLAHWRKRVDEYWSLGFVSESWRF